MRLPRARSLMMRYKSFLYLTGAVLASLIGPAFIYYNHGIVESKSAVIGDGKEKHKKKKDGKREFDPASISSRVFQGGAFEASDVVYVPGTDGVLFVDDNRSDEVLWMRLDQDGNQVGEIKPIKIGVSVEDPEGITFDGSWFYVVGSQSGTKVEETNALVRFHFDSETQSVKEVESAGGLYEFLTGAVPELKECAGKKGKKGTINIEGLAWDPVQGRLLLGLRDPEISEQALIVPLRLRDQNARLSLENLTLAQSDAIRISLGGATIRSIEYDGSLNVFQIISGAPESKKKTDFGLWEWDGQTSPREKVALNSKLKPEGVTRVSMGGHDFIFIVCDVGEYLKLDD
ncbi:MAG TPA: DUF3616 domain-containing protein [Blastocatellia bacterium]|nr:DUF3616 domain-containing protein [Blastocatellia bacterium]